MKSKLSLLLFITAVTIISCNKDNDKYIQNIPNKQPKARISTTDIGYYHNQALALTEDYWGQGGDVWNADSLLNYMRIKMSSEFPDDFGEVTLSEVLNASNTTQFENLMQHARDTGIGFINFYHSYLEDQLANNSISQELYDILVSWSNPNLTYEEAASILDNADVNSLSNHEQEVLSVAKSVFENSNSYWDTYSQTHTSERRLSNGTIGNIVDAVAAIGFFEAGPAGVFIAACCSSAWWD